MILFGNDIELDILSLIHTLLMLLLIFANVNEDGGKFKKEVLETGMGKLKRRECKILLCIITISYAVL